MTPKSYKDNFFSHHLKDSLQSARIVIPIVKSFVHPESVIDIGCGVGTWLSVWEENDVTDILGVDGDYVNESELLIEENKFRAFDLESKFQIDKRFDLASCLEVAEHISANSAEHLIKSLCDLSDIVLFSAAIPGQEGTMHINEQYPDYWVNLFLKNNYVPVDCLRKRIWMNSNISMWYRQNLLFFINQDIIKDLEILNKEYEMTNLNLINLVHPDYFNYKNNKIKGYEDKIAFYEGIINNKKNLVKTLLKQLLKIDNGKYNQ